MDTRSMWASQITVFGSSNSKGTFFGPFGSGIQNAPIPLVCVPEEARKHYERKVDPIAGEEGSGDANSPLKPSRITQIFKTAVYGGSATLVGSASNSSLAFNVVTNDLASLENTLRQHGLPQEDIEELQRALAADGKPPAKDKFGPKVAAWMGKMIGKAADGSWQIGIAVAGELLFQAIAKYYGF